MDLNCNATLIERNSIRYRFTGRTDNTCAICLGVTKRGEYVRRLPCLHMFHVLCVDTWLKQNERCPMCRKSLNEIRNDVIDLSADSDNSVSSERRVSSDDDVIEIIDITENNNEYGYLDWDQEQQLRIGYTHQVRNTSRENNNLVGTLSRFFRPTQRQGHIHIPSTDEDDDDRNHTDVLPNQRNNRIRTITNKREVINVLD